MSIHAHVVVDARGVDVRLDVPDGQTVALLGPNGSGKSTVLGAIAGILSPDRGRIVVNGRTLFDVGARADAGPDGRTPIDVPAHRRGVALLAQDPLLFPHLTARENVAFAPRSRGDGRAAARTIADARLGDVGAAALADTLPHRLSGGQARRVAVARALAADPVALLLDEPLVALDVAGRDEVRRVLASALAAVPGIVVTHDPLDALLLADRAVVLDAGRIVEDAATADLLAHPRTAFSARLAGVALVAGVVQGTGLVDATGLRIPGDPGPLAEGTPAFAAVPPDAVTVRADTLPARIDDAEGAPRVTHLDVVAGRLRVTAGGLVGTAADGADARAFAPGSPVLLDVDPRLVRLYAREPDVS